MKGRRGNGNEGEERRWPMKGRREEREVGGRWVVALGVRRPPFYDHGYHIWGR
jgi:hypothetical protein